MRFITFKNESFKIRFLCHSIWQRSNKFKRLRIIFWQYWSLAILIGYYGKELYFEKDLLPIRPITSISSSTMFVRRRICLFLFFLFSSIANSPKCLSHGYPCLETSHPPDPYISMCCSETTCQRSTNTQFTCGGNAPSKVPIPQFYFDTIRWFLV